MNYTINQEVLVSLFGFVGGLFGDNRDNSTNIDGKQPDDNILYKVLDTNSNPILLYTRKMGWFWANRAFFALSGYKDIEQFKSEKESLRDIFAYESEDIFTESDKTWLDYLRSEGIKDYSVGMVDGESKMNTLVARVSVIRDSGEDLYILRLDNITNVIKLREDMSKVEELQGKFLSNISHEFRTPMNGILGFIDLIGGTNLTELQQEYITSAQSSARNLMNNIENLLDLAQMQSGKLTVSNSDFSIVHELEDLARGIVPAAEDRDISALFFIDPKLPTTLTGDIRKIKQVILNLYQNALKFTPPKGRVTIEAKLLKRNTSGSCNIGFSVKDTGKGINKDELAQIIRPFVSGDQADNRLGVGLSLSHGLVKLMGSELKIVSEEGRGSSFSFALTLEGSVGHTMQMINNIQVKVLLLDESKIDDANHLTNYLRSFGLSVVKSQTIDENLYKDVECVYVVASQEKIDWLVPLSKIKREKRVILLIESGEKLQARMLHGVDEPLSKPLLPFMFMEHLTKTYNIPKPMVYQTQTLQRGIQALVVEDNLINQRLITLLLREYGVKVTVASNGEEAVDACRLNTYDIVFMDIDMPVKDGIVATQEIKEEKRYTKGDKMPIIALTALAMEGDKERILAEGLDDYISKPLTREKLEAVLHKYLEVTV